MLLDVFGLWQVCDRQDAANLGSREGFRPPILARFRLIDLNVNVCLHRCADRVAQSHERSRYIYCAS